MRSLLVVPADSEARLAEALTAPADAVCLDLEDAVVAKAKAAARKNAGAWVAAAKARARRPLIFVRVNGLDTDLIDADLDAIMPTAPDGVLLPKCADGRALQHLGAKLAVKEAECGLTDGSTRIMAMSGETAASLFHMGTYAGASRRLIALAWSAESVCGSVGAESCRCHDGAFTAPIALARNLIVFAARSACVLAIDSASADFCTADRFRLECEAARSDGFDGKIAVDRHQVETINGIFTAAPRAVERARAVIAAFAAEPGARTVILSGKIMNSSHLLRARRIVRQLADGA